ncbi:hypothetical protein NBRC110019_09650 [Neptunitalea chrysea]|uniref:Uncharacterized protein n=2 Tax=Neptunitalea chrysea TaxID=1647581 RepID=A0A9W6B3P7_9FLAO|nr:hypothetical protein NBRC110019_09650 [Neptunitalea chrysea]
MKILASTQLIHVNRFDFLSGQLFFFLGSTIVLLAGLIALILYHPFKKYRFLFFSFVFTLALFTYLKAKDYYAIGLYPIYIAFGSVYLVNVLQETRFKLAIPILIACPILLFIPMYSIAFPNKPASYIKQHKDVYKNYGMLRWEDGKDHDIPQDYADMLGWKELANKVEKVYNQMPNPKTTLILCDNYGQAGAINYYTKHRVIANSFEADYINWFNLETKYHHFIRIKSAQNKGNEFEETSPFFEKSYIADSITNPYARESGTTIFVFENSKVNINDRIKHKLLQLDDE